MTYQHPSTRSKTWITTRGRRDPVMSWKGQAGATCSTIITRAEAARLLVWWRAQAKGGGR